jgi:hypothetical protein
MRNVRRAEIFYRSTTFAKREYYDDDVARPRLLLLLLRRGFHWKAQQVFPLIQLRD